MTTYTLTGDLGDLIGDDPELIAARLVLVNAPYAVESGEVRFPVVRLTLDEAGTFTQAGIPGSATGYQYQVVAEYAPSEPGMGNEIITIGPFDLLADTDLGDVATVEFNPITRPALDHGSVSGAVAISAAYGLHEMTLTGDVVLTPSGQFGADIAVLVHPATHQVTLAGSDWFAIEPTFDTGDVTLTFIHWPSGWRVYPAAIGDPVESGTPTAASFDDDYNDLTIPAVTGVQYQQDGVNISAGTYTLQPAGLTEITAVAKTGYVLPAGTFGPWSHTYAAPPAWSTVATDTFTGTNGTDLNVHTADTGEAWTMAGGTLEIQSNKLDNASGHGFSPLGTMTLDAAYPLGVRVSADYDVSVVSGAHVGTNYVSTTYGGDQLFGVRIGATGALLVEGAGVDDFALTGTTTGHPGTGNLKLECVGTAITISVNGVAVATATLPGTLIGAKAWVQLDNADSLAENFSVEGYA